MNKDKVNDIISGMDICADARDALRTIIEEITGESLKPTFELCASNIDAYLQKELHTRKNNYSPSVIVIKHTKTKEYAIIRTKTHITNRRVGNVWGWVLSWSSVGTLISFLQRGGYALKKND